MAFHNSIKNYGGGGLYLHRLLVSLIDSDVKNTNNSFISSVGDEILHGSQDILFN